MSFTDVHHPISCVSWTTRSPSGHISGLLGSQAASCRAVALWESHSRFHRQFILLYSSYSRGILKICIFHFWWDLKFSPLATLQLKRLGEYFTTTGQNNAKWMCKIQACTCGWVRRSHCRLPSKPLQTGIQFVCESVCSQWIHSWFKLQNQRTCRAHRCFFFSPLWMFDEEFLVGGRSVSQAVVLKTPMF